MRYFKKFLCAIVFMACAFMAYSQDQVSSYHNRWLNKDYKVCEISSSYVIEIESADSTKPIGFFIAPKDLDAFTGYVKDLKSEYGKCVEEALREGSSKPFRKSVDIMSPLMSVTWSDRGTWHMQKNVPLKAAFIMENGRCILALRGSINDEESYASYYLVFTCLQDFDDLVKAIYYKSNEKTDIDEIFRDLKL